MSKLVSCRLLLLCGMIIWLPLLALPGRAEQTREAETIGPPNYAEQAAALWEQIEEAQSHTKALEARLEGKNGMAAMILQWRIEQAVLNALELSHRLCQLVIDQESAGEDPGPFRAIAKELLQVIPQRLMAGIEQQLAAEESISGSSGLSAIEQIAFEDDRERLLKRRLQAYKILLRNLQLSDELGLESSQQRDFLNGSLAEAAANHSIALEISRRFSKTLDRQKRALPDDTELAAKVRVNGERNKLLNDALRQMVEMMEQLDLRTVEYRQQLVAASGAVTTDILDLEVLRGLLENWLKAAGTWAKDNLPGIVFNLLLFLLIVWAAFAMARLTRRLVTRGLNQRPSNLSQLLRRTIISSTGNIVLILGLLFGLAQLGISVGPVLAGLGIAGFIVGFALQDTLGNFASGVLILLYRPYDVGDFVETNGVLGKVSQMSLVNTTVLTIDNQTLVLPNSKIWGDVIKNVTAQRERRVDMVFGIGYADDIARAERVLVDIVNDHDKVLEDPAPVVRLHVLNESSVDFVVRPWVRTEDYWDVYWDITRAVKIRFDQEGISIPFPQRDIHLIAGGTAIATAAGGEVNIKQPSVAPAGTEPGEDPPPAQAT